MLTTRNPLPALVIRSVFLFLLGAATCLAEVQTIAYYRLGEEGVLNDSSGNGYGLVASGGVTASTSVPESSKTPLAPSTISQSFDGTTAVLARPDGGVLTTADDNMGIEAWVRSDDPSKDCFILHHGYTSNPSSARGFGLMQVGGNYVGHLAGIAYVTGPPIESGVWTHLAFLVRRGNFELYVNGQLYAQLNSGGFRPVDTDLDTFSIGALANAGGNGGVAHFPGQLDEVRVFTFDPADFFTGDLNYYDTTLPPWAFLFDWSAVPEISPGIRHARFTITNPRLNLINALRVDLSHPDIRLGSTPRSPDYGQPFGNGYIVRTARENTQVFLDRNRSEGRNMVAAINAAPFLPWPPVSSDADKLGLLVEEGVVVCEQTNSPYVSSSLIFNKDWTADMVASKEETVDISRVLTAVSGFGPVLADGTASGSEGNDAQPRTGIGLSKDKKTLILLTVDGRQSGTSLGMGTRELGDMLRHFGARDGMNMDGGGSTTMVLYDPDANASAVVNSPSAGLRRVGNSLGVFYVGTPEPVNLDDWLNWRGVPAGSRGPNDDPSGDGFPNLLAYLLNIHPLGGLRPDDVHGRPRQEIITDAQGEDFLAITFRVNRHATDITYGVIGTPSLATGGWSVPEGLVLEDAGTDPQTNDALVRAVMPLAGAKQFFARIQATQN